MVYSTAQLIEIVEQELRAAWRGDRQLLAPEKRLDLPMVASALDLGQVSRVYAVQDFKAQIHQYQEIHGISGIIWRSLTYRGKTIELPEIHPHLTAIATDMVQLAQATDGIVEFWWEQTQGDRYWQGGYPPQPLTKAAVEAKLSQGQWLELDGGLTELYLGICWGQWPEYRYRWAHPHSGCDRLIASATSPPAINIY